MQADFQICISVPLIFEDSIWYMEVVGQDSKILKPKLPGPKQWYNKAKRLSLRVSGAIIYLLQKVCKVPTQSLRNLSFVKLQVFGRHFYWKNPEETFLTSWNYQTILQNSLDLVFLGSTHASKLIVAIELDSRSRTYFLRFPKYYYENIF